MRSQILCVDCPPRFYCATLLHHKLINPLQLSQPQTKVYWEERVFVLFGYVVFKCNKRSLKSLNVILLFSEITNTLQCVFLQQLIRVVAVVINNFHLFNNVDHFPFRSSLSSSPRSPVPLPLSPYVSQFTGDVLFWILWCFLIMSVVDQAVAAHQPSVPY